ncbi:MAG TPA: ASCH domain-containing protein [Phycisphaerales bacterium]|nr:ASCH domain-containing protein [Phycisphaerales bacterium]HRQ76012.1 ASCH domain-containing protein [Phycisphaerales bacterium]
MIHVAVLLKPYLDLVLSGEKTVECRMTRQARAPFECVEPNERIYLKQSAGPYRAAAIADHVLCEANLTPRRIAEIKRDYNDLIRGDDAVWEAKRDSRFITLIWLRDVQAIDTGPAIRPLQGAAWLTLEEEPAWRKQQPVAQTGGGRSGTSRGSATAGASSFFIEITPGNIRNGSLYLTGVLDRFPEWAIGGPNKAEAATPMTLMLHEGPRVETDIVGPRKLLRTRIWRSWFARHGAQPGDRVVFTPMDEATYFVGLTRPRR